jgi:DNA primase
MKEIKKFKLDVSNPQVLIYNRSNLSFTILGGVRLGSLDKLRCTLKISCKEDTYPFRTNIDLYHRDQSEKLIREITDHFQLQITEVRKAIFELTDELERYRIELNTLREQIPVIPITEQEKNEAIKYLKEPDLLKKLMLDIGKTGIVKEELNRLLMYLVFTSRKLNNPLHIYTVGSSGSGKTYLQHKISELIPAEDRIEITTLTNNSLYYCTKEEMDGKLLLIEDLDGLGTEAMYLIRELQTSQKITRTLAEREANGNIRTVKKVLEARISLAGTTTKEIYEDNSNRAIIIHPDNSAKQSHAIIEYQKMKASGKINQEEQQKYIQVLQNIQRVLEPVIIINPLAGTLKLPDIVSTPRRLMTIYLTLIETITYIHQYQRKEKKDKAGNIFIETTKEDIKWANLLLKDTLLNKSDDLSPSVRAFLQELKSVIKNKESFSAKDVKSRIRIPSPTLYRYIKELITKEYFRVEGNRYKGYYYSIKEDDFESIQKQIECFSVSVVSHK